jgi:site-specific recombinase XerD
MGSYMAADLLRWRRQSDYASDDDYLFASETMKAKQPYWPDNLMKRHIRPVAKANGINKNIGWHTFRHSFGTLLEANGEDVKTVQELLRYANSRITLDVYAATNKSSAPPGRRFARTPQWKPCFTAPAEQLRGAWPGYL